MQKLTEKIEKNLIGFIPVVRGNAFSYWGKKNHMTS